MGGKRIYGTRHITAVAIALICVASLVVEIDVEARSTGAPIDMSPGICSTMKPDHGLPAQTGESPYMLSANTDSYDAQQQVTVTVTKTGSQASYKGIFLQMRRADNDVIIGSWSVADSTNFQTLSCGAGQNNAVTHKNGNIKAETTTFMWTAPDGETPDVKVLASFVRDYTTFFVKVEGPTLQGAANPCNPTPCLAGGTCVPSGSSFSCICPPTRTGPTCHIIVAPCSSNPCLNGGVCSSSDDLESYTCICPPSFSGVRCQTAVLPCSSNPCLNEGTCTDGNNEFTCTCPVGFAGSTCENAVSPCMSNACLNGATCEGQLGENAYTCSCAAGFTGTLCDSESAETTAKMTTSEGHSFTSNLIITSFVLVITAVMIMHASYTS